MPYSRPVESFWTTDDVNCATKARVGRLLVRLSIFFPGNKVTNVQPERAKNASI